MTPITRLSDLSVLEFRRYTLREGERRNFALYFESFFPEAFQQLGALALGQFFELENPRRFTWIRGFRDGEARAAVNAAFYDGPLWKEHAARMNDRMVDSDNVLLLRPLDPGRGVPVLPAVDPVAEEAGARGILAAQIFTVKEGQVEALAAKAEPVFALYRAAGAREAGLLATYAGPNTFPRHPVREDGPHLVWLGIFPDEEALKSRYRPLAESSRERLAETGLLRGPAELVTLEPTRRSRLRWLPGG
jgi:NIPSNAP protein